VSVTDEWFEVVVEIPKGSRNKYEIDHATGEVWLDRHLFTATTYPADYGFIPETLGEDGEGCRSLPPIAVRCRMGEVSSSPPSDTNRCSISALGLLWMRSHRLSRPLGRDARGPTRGS